MSSTPKSLSKIKKIKEKIQKIQNVINKQGKYGYYLLIDNEVKLISKGDNKKELDYDVFHKIAKKRSTIGCFIYLVEVHIDEKYVSKPNKIIVGPVHLKIKQFKISNRFELIHKANYKNGAVWYTIDDILEGGFHFTDIKQLVKEIHDRNILIVNMGGLRALKILQAKKE